MVVRAYPTVAYLFSTVLDCLLEQGLCKYYVACPVGTDTVPVGGLQALVGFLGLQVFLIWGYPYKVSISLVIIVVYKYSGFLESCMG